MKKSTLYIIVFLLTFIVLVVSITLNYLFNNYSITGKVNINKTYSKIKYENVLLNFDTNIEVKIYEKDNNINIKVPSMNEIKSEKNIRLTLLNIGNKDTNLINCIEEKIDTSLKDKHPYVRINPKENTIIKAGESNYLNIYLKYDGIESVNNYYNFNVKCTFD